jgi:photosystem I P700 chlorophyll a apoprotein A1
MVEGERSDGRLSRYVRERADNSNISCLVSYLHADAHDFDSHTSDLEEISRKVFSAHFGQLGIILIWLSGCDTMKHVF